MNDQDTPSETTATAVARSRPPRQHTRFQTCENHRWLDGLPRYRRAEFFVEGGPADSAGCQGGTCRLWPGRDLFAEEYCRAELPLDWANPTAEEWAKTRRDHENTFGDPPPLAS